MPKMSNPDLEVMPAPGGTDSPGGLTRTLGADSTAGNRGRLTAEQEGGTAYLPRPAQPEGVPITGEVLGGNSKLSPTRTPTSGDGTGQ